MASLESYTREPAAIQYINSIRADIVKKEEPPKEDSDTERILVTIVTTALVGAPLALMVSKLLPNLSIYEFCKYIPLYNLPF